MLRKLTAKQSIFIAVFGCGIVSIGLVIFMALYGVFVYEEPVVVAVHTVVVTVTDSPQSEEVPTSTAVPTMVPTSRPTRTPRPTAIPTMAPPKVTLEPVVLAEVSGVGDTVTDNFVWPQCQKAIFYWGAEPDSEGDVFLTIYLWNVDKDRPAYLVGEYESDRTEALRGASHQPLAGGEYYFVIENTTGAWTITVICED